MSTTAADGLKAAADATLTTKSSTGSDTSATEASDKETQENETEEDNSQSVSALASVFSSALNVDSSLSRGDEIKAAKHLSSGIDSFDPLNIPVAIRDAMEQDMKLTAPLPIQALAIPFIMEGYDLIAQAQTGSGKTVAFGVGLLTRIDPTVHSCQALVLAPTRELADQIARLALMKLAARMTPTVEIEIGIRGKEIKKGDKSTAHVIVGTPGTIEGWISNKYFAIKNLKVMVLDEADHMIADDSRSQTFKQKVMKIRNKCRDAQMLLFSATYPGDCRAVCHELTRPSKTKEIGLEKEQLLLDEIVRIKIKVPPGKKLDVLQDMYDVNGVQSSIVFLDTKKEADEVTRMMTAADYKVATLHGGLQPEQRDAVMNEFREGKSKFLITTNVLARGVDVPDVSLVVNYNVPRKQSVANGPLDTPDDESYVHRIGRTGRCGRKGRAVTFVETTKDRDDLMWIENQLAAKGGDTSNTLIQIDDLNTLDQVTKDDEPKEDSAGPKDP
jgi:ATP-dependent RNA helicase DDX19/DBP5